jgi:hypothetical protein
MKTLPSYLALVKASEHELVKAFDLMMERHKDDFEVREGCRLFRDWSQKHCDVIVPAMKRYGRAALDQPALIHNALFQGNRPGGYGLLRDLQELLLLVHQTRTSWTALSQAAKEMKEMDLARTIESCASETDRQIDWICTQVKSVAPQALTVPVSPADAG